MSSHTPEYYITSGMRSWTDKGTGYCCWIAENYFTEKLPRGTLFISVPDGHPLRLKKKWWLLLNGKSCVTATLSCDSYDRWAFVVEESARICRGLFRQVFE